MFQTRLTAMLGIPHPIFMGGMQWLSTAEFVAPAARAGILAFLTAETFADADELRAEIRKTRGLTDRPFGVNISMVPEVGAHHDRALAFARVAAEEGVAAVETAGRDPSPLIPVLKAAGVRVFHKTPVLRHARKAVDGGVDGIIALGCECGGHPGMNDTPLSILLPRALDLLGVPVVAAGGIADARGFVSALAHGADAVLMGTRFVATEECPLHEAIKRRFLDVTELDTTFIMRSLGNPMRCYKNATTRKVLEMEARGATLEEILGLVAGRIGREAYAKGDPEGAPVVCGLAASLVHEIRPIAAVVGDMIDDAHGILARLRDLEIAGCSN
ncbi:MAG TPA: nitronate monooxygenase [Syntrophales bacterium]|nr:nitronate monooxygenase [Syntrophales bacterium]